MEAAGCSLNLPCVHPIEKGKNPCIMLNISLTLPKFRGIEDTEPLHGRTEETFSVKHRIYLNQKLIQKIPGAPDGPEVRPSIRLRGYGASAETRSRWFLGPRVSSTWPCGAGTAAARHPHGSFRELPPASARNRPPKCRGTEQKLERNGLLPAVLVPECARSSAHSIWCWKGNCPR